jgi:hypothetical protein
LTTQLEDYARRLCGRTDVRSAEIFAKILTPNDDAGRHGVLIPNESCSFFPELPVADPQANATVLFRGIDAANGKEKDFGWKYYQRYPERRITRLNARFNDMDHGRRMAIFVRATLPDDSVIYAADVRLEDLDENFNWLIRTLFGRDVEATPGAFIRIPVDAPTFHIDDALAELLARYDRVSALGWVNSERTGDTGVGYTFETLVGIKENNDQGADFRGIEIKCSTKKPAASKTNLFQLGPKWMAKQSGIARLQQLGQLDNEGLWACYSQVTTSPNNLELSLALQLSPRDIDLYKGAVRFGTWENTRLSKRLLEKHSRAVFVTADSRIMRDQAQYRYHGLVYCERPDIQQFLDMVESRRIVFEFLMRENPPGRVRNHGYPWRLVDQRELGRLFAMQVRLRG